MLVDIPAQRRARGDGGRAGRPHYDRPGARGGPALAAAESALPFKTALLHGHCHQKAFGAMADVAVVLRLAPGLEVQLIESSCCGMAGAFGYEAAQHDVSMKMAEASPLPAVRQAGADALIVADSCRHQIADGAGRAALHVTRVLEQALA